MKTVIVLSDTHRNIKAIESIKNIMDESDYVIHLGDFSSDMREYKKLYGEKLIIIDGNCDMFSAGESEKLIEIEEVKLFCCHGHKYGVKSGTERLKERGRELKADICLFGHTHEALVLDSDGIRLINPGCMTNLSPVKSYAYIVINGKKAVVKSVAVK